MITVSDVEHQAMLEYLAALAAERDRLAEASYLGGPRSGQAADRHAALSLQFEGACDAAHLLLGCEHASDLTDLALDRAERMLCR